MVLFLVLDSGLAILFFKLVVVIGVVLFLAFGFEQMSLTCDQSS